ncbi:MAG TPA: 30S ribosomal protein S20 [Candidatus Levybacteria bacterium]|nr:30S ribosomal protein S20 [Candidatus Levybacteria bacterium]
MPVIKSAIKKLRRDKKVAIENELFRNKLETVVRAAKKSKSDKDISSAFSVIDKAVKKHLIHKNKGSRIKSALVTKKAVGADIKAKKVSVAKKAKPAVKKAPSKKSK